MQTIRAALVASALVLLLADADARASVARGPLGLRFEANVGQADPRVRFLSRGSGHTLFLTDREAVLVLRGNTPGAVDVVRMGLVGARFAAEPAGGDELSGKTNYFLGRDPRRWQRGVTAYGSVRYAQVYPGIDLVYHGRRGALEYDFRVAAGSDPGRVLLAFDGLRTLGLDGDGNLVLATSAGRTVQHRPVAYQEIGDSRRPVDVDYVVAGPSRVRLSIGTYDPSLPLIIDPVLSYSSYLGGASDDSGAAVAVDLEGNWYIAGQTASLDFPVTGGAVQPTYAGGADAFVARIDSSGTSLSFATYLGGSGSDVGNGIAVDSSGNVYVAGETSSADFPVTAGAFQTSSPGRRAGFVAKLDPSGAALVYSTYLGGSATARCNAIAVDGAGAAYVAGRTDSANFPTTPGVLFPTYRGGQFDAYVTKLNAGGTGLVYSTFMGGSNNDALFGIALGPGNTACVAGGSDSPDYPTTASAYQNTVQDTDPVITKLDANATQLLYSTFLGGSLDMERANAIAADPAGFLYVTGFTPSTDFPVVNAAQPDKGAAYDAWAARLNPNASGAASLVYSTFIGGDGNDRGNGIAVDPAGNACVVGQTSDGTGFPVVDPIQSSYGGGSNDAFVVRLASTGAFTYSTFLGGAGSDQANAVAVRGTNAFVVGTTDSVDFPTVSPLQAANRGGSDAFFARIQGPSGATPVPGASPPVLLLLGAALALVGGLLLRRG